MIEVLRSIEYTVDGDAFVFHSSHVWQKFWGDQDADEKSRRDVESDAAAAADGATGG